MSSARCCLTAVVIHPYGLLIALGVAAGLWVMSREEKRLRLPRDTGLDLILYALPPAIVFSRLYYVVFSWELFRDDPVRALFFWDGGLAIYGGVIGGALGVFVLSRRRGIAFAALADLAAPSLILGQAIGRWGNFINREAYGYAVLDPLWQFFPAAVRIGDTWHMATFFYESLWNFIGFLFLRANRSLFRDGGRTGQIFLWYLIWYGFGRLVIEGLRTDSLMLGPLRVSQLFSALLCVSGILLAAWPRRVWSPMVPLIMAALAGSVHLCTGKAVPAVISTVSLAAAGFLLYRRCRLDARRAAGTGRDGGAS